MPTAEGRGAFIPIVPVEDDGGIPGNESRQTDRQTVESSKKLEKASSLYLRLYQPAGDAKKGERKRKRKGRLHHSTKERDTCE
jgi:hypothetical protein